MLIINKATNYLRVLKCTKNATKRLKKQILRNYQNHSQIKN